MDWKAKFDELDKAANESWDNGYTKPFDAIGDGYQNAADTYGSEDHEDFYRIAYMSIGESEYFDQDWFARFSYYR